ncbi:hypothetical protein [Nonomuraea africana]|uniref:Uncharacterized protein n=1 Tax=Nonomuraea africana TaxID=46171 RepID=A0ABR9KN44_9ACTN|nr:hypothetical protein [Nonomuraea africana]MBE1563446.1 hypothetical protein [Nonomuraea africana]
MPKRSFAIVPLILLLGCGAHVSAAVRKVFADQLEAIRRKQDPEIEPVKGVTLLPELSSEAARPYLTREIRAALDDLECGKEFHPMSSPKRTSLQARVDAEFGQ